MHGDMMHAVSYLRIWIRNVLRFQAAVDRLPAFSAIICAECPRRGNGDEHSLWILLIQNDRMQTHSSGAGLPIWAGAMATKTSKFVPRLAAVSGAENRGVFDSRVGHIGIVQ